LSFLAAAPRGVGWIGEGTVKGGTPAPRFSGMSVHQSVGAGSPVRHISPPAAVVPQQVEPWVTKRQLAVHLGFSTRWVELRLREGMPSRLMGGCRRFRLSEVEDWVDARQPATRPRAS
jgi:hypothetical protein